MHAKLTFVGLSAAFAGLAAGTAHLAGTERSAAVRSIQANAATAVPVSVETALRKPADDAPAKVAIEPATEIVDGFPASLTVESGSQTKTLQLTGRFARVRVLLIIPVGVYEIASYVEAPKEGATTALLDDLLVDGPAKVYMLRFSRSLSGKQIMSAIKEEIDWTFTDVDMEKNGKDVERFTQKFCTGSNKGDIVYMCWMPGNRIYCSFNDPKDLELISSDFSLTRAIWRIWAGETAGPERLGLVQRFASDSANR